MVYFQRLKINHAFTYFFIVSALNMPDFSRDLPHEHDSDRGVRLSAPESSDR